VGDVKKVRMAFQLRIRPDLREAIKAYAKAEDRTLASLVIWILRRHLIGAGFENLKEED